ncbi:Protein of unknown function [Pyronema omphalodes CBS 100304]|uniref:Uncharacterized protein n=1 Tax=Pyronema omphalodes (strain CBS 100304) TaxID=1076935 RepID=U4L8F2_PYROM|nr:Protein of unknown function [Pyronema omphalodes CBS 100304]
MLVVSVDFVEIADTLRETPTDTRKAVKKAQVALDCFEEAASETHLTRQKHCTRRVYAKN